MVHTMWRDGTPVLYATRRKKNIRKQKRVRKNEDNFKDDSRMRLANMKKPRHS
jgi:hypothetical protein